MLVWYSKIVPCAGEQTHIKYRTRSNLQRNDRESNMFVYVKYVRRTLIIKTNQPGLPPSLIRVFAVRTKKAWVLSHPLSAREDADQSGRMPRLIWVFAGHTVILLVLSCLRRLICTCSETKNNLIQHPKLRYQMRFFNNKCKTKRTTGAQTDRNSHPDEQKSKV